MSDHVDGPRQIGDPASISPICSRSPARKMRDVPCLPQMSFPRRVQARCSPMRSITRSWFATRPWPSLATPRGSRQATRSIASIVDLVSSSVDQTARAQLSAAPAPFLMARDLILSSMTKKGHQLRTECFACLRACAPIPSFLLGSRQRSKRLPTCCSTTTCFPSSSNSILAVCSTPIKARCSESLPKQARCLARLAQSDMNHRASIGSAARNRPTCVLTILPWRGRTTCATYGISRLRLRLPKSSSPYSAKRLIDSLTNWDMRDGKADWTPATLAASANVYLDDFLLFDVSKPISDTSFLEIEKSTLHGHAYQTGGGRTVNANVIDIMITWMVNNDREFLQGGATGATKPGGNSFPYLASPNTQLQTVVDSVDLSAQPDQVWALIGPFGGTWHPLIARIQVTGTGIGQLRTIETIDGKQIIERLEAIDNSQRFYRYTMISGIPASDYTGTLDVKPKGAGSSVEWRVQYLADGQPDFIVRTIVTTFLKTGLDSLQARFGAQK